ncbi:bile acid 7-alpha dehydratase [Mycolicibacterium phlei]|uniref:Polyketide cyclase n=1 Tax=Mycolicibacterium phlei DSM 43239 = CCUG 21000 TaxID=1226750 RepID=A0A5N5UXM9_MYCPH|nr:nuclear transport factor 2 family protein [Mycolicibacterium phlei]VEG09589.1 bile acid 7-alpha dehydratase [Mycobacteroides chelonae]AMO61477.1 SnoaL-like domain protein [Mycolicibacterium phlei]KAB7754364.1 polyketide cyclase [Mycolicibacterium phlei DSM 43239 = CCUG 21000]KXW63958.1 polyketide cyclase [Mycolicibacterium phlei DSM 43239 = CCUG 21000]KXW66661.1 polyketide cyclase [Mycolicibacterium phlei DSM 43070]
MSDRDDIIDVLVRYATGIDSRDWDLLRSCFTDDATFDYGPIGLWSNPDSLTRYMKGAHSGPSMHRLTNFAITVDGDTATARTYVDATVMGPGGVGAVENFGWYDDRLVRTPDGWRIAFRRTTLHGIRLPGLLRVVPPTLGVRLAGRMGRRRR